MRCYRHREREAVGACAACGKGLCGEGCAHDGAAGLHCDDVCARRLDARDSALRAPAPRAPDAIVGWAWSALVAALGAALLAYGYRYSEFSMSVPNLLGMLLLWYGVVLLLQRGAARRS